MKQKTKNYIKHNFPGILIIPTVAILALLLVTIIAREIYHNRPPFQEQYIGEVYHDVIPGSSGFLESKPTQTLISIHQDNGEIWGITWNQAHTISTLPQGTKVEVTYGRVNQGGFTYLHYKLLKETR